MNAEFVFVDGAQQDEVLGNKAYVEELPDEPEIGEGADDGGEPASDAGADDDIYGNIEDMDLFIAKFLLSIIDDTRATALSTWAWGDIEHSDKYRYYKDLDAPQHKALVMAAAYVVRKYRLSKSPEVILLIGLGMSTFMVWQIARADRKERKEKEEKAKEEAMQKVREQMQRQQQQQQQEKGRVIDLNQFNNQQQNTSFI